MPASTAEIVRIVTPLPVRPRSVNAYLVPLRAGGWMLVDGGLDSDDAWDALSAPVDAVGGWSEIRLHFVTHMHLDHIGLAGRVREATSAPLCMGELDAERAEHAAANPAEEAAYRTELLRSNGAPPEAMGGGGSGAGPDRPGFTRPDHRLACGSGRLSGAPEWMYLWTPGHTAGHTSLFRAEDGILIAGDAVLPRISPTIGVNRQRQDPVADYLAALGSIERLAPRSILPGHGEALSGRERVRELQTEVERESERVAAELVRAPGTAWEIAERRYAGRELPPALRMLAFRETLAHLLHLVDCRRARRTTRAAGIDHFEPVGTPD